MTLQRSYLLLVSVVQAKPSDQRIFSTMVGLTGEEQFKLRAKRALETGNRSFKPRGKNKTTFETMKQEFDATRSHVTKEADRVIDEIKPLAAFFSGCESTDPQERIDARLLQNALNAKANKRDRELIKAQKANAKANKAKVKPDAKRRKVCEEESKDESPPRTSIRAGLNVQPRERDIALSEEEFFEEEEDSAMLLDHLKARAADEYDTYARWHYEQLDGSCNEKARQLRTLLTTKRDVWQATMSKTLKEKVQVVIDKLKGPQLMKPKAFAASLNHDLSNKGSNLRVDATFDYEIRCNGNTVAAVPKVGVLEA